MSTVHQIIPVLATHDAVGGHTLRVQSALQQHGIRSEIFAEVIVGGVASARRLSEFDSAGGGADLLIYQASTGSDSADWLLRRSEPFAVNHHNMTPAHFFDRWAPEAADNMRRARNQLRAMAPRSVAGLADSAFNAVELEELGYQDVSVTPLLLGLGAELPSVDPRTQAHLTATRAGAHWLFVGRMAPNKCQHDVVAAFAIFRKLYDPGARLTLVGSPAAVSYQEAILRLADELGLGTAVTLLSGLNDEELAAYYEDADVFVCLSEHEGFCVPIIEAFRHATPVVALAEAAVPDTAGAAAVLLDDKDPLLVASAVHEVLADTTLQAGLRSAAQARLDAFRPERTVPVFVAAVERAVAAAGRTRA